MTSIPWRNEPLVAVSHPEHRSGCTQKVISLGDLEGESFVAFESGLRIRAEIDREFMVGKIDVNIAQEFDNIETMKRAIEVNEGTEHLARADPGL